VRKILLNVVLLISFLALAAFTAWRMSFSPYSAWNAMTLFLCGVNVTRNVGELFDAYMTRRAEHATEA
jgi:hypothetical protein